MTGAERQQAWRQRRARRATALEADNARLRAELADVREQLTGALAEADRQAAPDCRHPSGEVDGGTCRACGSEVW